MGEASNISTDSAHEQLNSVLAQVVRSANSPIVILDMQGNIRYANSAAVHAFPLPPEYFVGQSIQRVLAKESWNRVWAALLGRQHLQAEVRMHLPPGGPETAWVSLTPLSDGASLIFQDLSVPLKSLQEMRRQLDDLLFQQRVNRAITSSLELDQILAVLMEETRRTVGAEACSAALYDEPKNEIFFLVAEGAGAEEVRGRRMPADRGVIGWVVLNRQPLLVVDAYSDERFFSDIDKLTGQQTRSLMAAPLVVEGRVIGALEAMNKRDGKFSEDDLVLFQLMAASAATAIANALMYQHQQAMTDQLSLENRTLLVSREREIREERLKLIEQLGAAISHEVNNSLVGILSMAEWLLLRQDLPTELMDDLATIRDQAVRIRNVVRRLSELNHDATVTYLGSQLMLDLSHEEP